MASRGEGCGQMRKTDPAKLELCKAAYMAAPGKSLEMAAREAGIAPRVVYAASAAEGWPEQKAQAAADIRRASAGAMDEIMKVARMAETERMVVFADEIISKTEGLYKGAIRAARSIGAATTDMATNSNLRLAQIVSDPGADERMVLGAATHFTRAALDTAKFLHETGAGDVESPADYRARVKADLIERRQYLREQLAQMARQGQGSISQDQGRQAQASAA